MHASTPVFEDHRLSQSSPRCTTPWRAPVWAGVRQGLAWGKTGPIQVVQQRPHGGVAVTGQPGQMKTGGPAQDGPGQQGFPGLVRRARGEGRCRR